MEGRYPIRAVAKITGLGLDTIRSWERRYRAVVPERSERGRVYTPAQIERLLRLSQLTRKGHAIGEIASLGDQDLDDLLKKQLAHAPAEAAAAGNLLDAVLSAVDVFDSRRAGDELSRLAAILSPRDLIYDVAMPLMRETGNRWHSGRFGIAQEHLVSQILRNLLGSMMRLFQPSGVPVKMVFATPVGEFHDLGILSSAMLASLAGIEPVYLGPNLPAKEIAYAADRTAARVITIGVTLPSETLSAEIAALLAEMPARVELWVGGNLSHFDFSAIGRRTVEVKDLPAFENECVRLKKETYENHA